MPQRENPLAELAAIAQLYRAVSPEPGIAQHQAIQMFGLMQQQQEAQQRQQMAMQQLEMQRAGQQQELELQQRAADMNDWRVTDESNRAYNEQAGREAVLKQQAAMALLQNFAGMPGTTGQDVLGLAQKQGVSGADAMLQALTQSANRKSMQEVMPGISAAYGQFQDDPRKAKSALDMLMQDPRMTPEVNSMIPWEQLNAGVPVRPAATAFAGREGGAIPGLLTQMNPASSAQATVAGIDPELVRLAAQRRKQLYGEPSAFEKHPIDTTWNFLFGQPK